MKTLRDYQKEVAFWSYQNFGQSVGYGHRPLLGVGEEVGELMHAHLKMEQGIRLSEDHETKRKDAVGDILIYLMDYCAQTGIDIQECLETTWTQVQKRNWKQNKIDGTV